jgi:HTH-type transcriptional regulator/antitoxin HigA
METLTDTVTIEKVIEHFRELTALVPLHRIESEGELDAAVAALNMLLDGGAADGTHPLADLVFLLGSRISAYEDIHYPREETAPADVLRLLMEQHNLSQSDLPEIGGHAVLSEILNGNRQLNTRQIKRLAVRFSVPAAVFM